MSQEKNPDRVRVVSSHGAANGPRRRHTDWTAPIIEIAGEHIEKDAISVLAGARLWGIPKPLLVTFLAGCGIGGVVAALVASL